MSSAIQKNFRMRRSFAKLDKVIDIPNLIDIQKKSYDGFLQRDIDHDKREDIGLQRIFKSVFPVSDFSETSELQFVRYHLEKPKYDVDECRARGMTFASPIKVYVQLVSYDISDGSSEQRSIRDIKEQEVYFGEIPLMTDSGVFVINGSDRVIVSQLHRSPGVFFDHDKGKQYSKLLYNARVIPFRGSWLDFEFDHKDIIYVRVDRRRKLPATVLLRALGFSTEELLDYFYDTEKIYFEAGKKYSKEVKYHLLKGQRATRDIKHPETKEVLVKKNRKFTNVAIQKLEESKVKVLPIDVENINGKISVKDVVDVETGEVLLQCNEELTEAKLDELRDHSVSEIEVLFIDGLNVGPYLRNTLIADKMKSVDEAILEIYHRLRPEDTPTIETAKKLLHNMFFNPDRYDLSQVGRLKLNYKFKLDESIDNTVLTKHDIMETVRYLLELRDGRGFIDDIDHLGNRRVRAVGELMENQYRIGLSRMERAIKERMSMSQEIETIMPQDLINAKPVTAIVKEYFGSSQLSQFMDQTNPLSEVTHKRRLSALGPGGLTRERAGFEVRDVHTTHYGRICPIETPEGPNIGLIASLATFARINEYGFIETPYRRVVNATLSSEIKFYSALEEEGHSIAQADALVDEQGRLVGEMVSCRQNGEFVMTHPNDVALMDVSPNQLVSVAASMIPFLDHDDANRALMGSNMQRQAVPLIRTAAPLIGTGLEHIVARDSGVTIVAKRDGVVDSVDAGRIVVRPVEKSNVSGAKPDIYNLVKFQRSNQNTCINQKPIVREGDVVSVGDVIGDGPATECGELALGQNAVVAFMPWGGYNFEDSILVSERLVREDVFTSVHIEEFECVARDTKIGEEEITRDIPNVGEEFLNNLDDSGIIRVGAEVSPGDILVGKITPKAETQLLPEEKLLRAIFGEKAGDVRDSSMRVSPGCSGVVINARVFSRKEIYKDDRSKSIDDVEKSQFLRNQQEEVKIIGDSYYAKIQNILMGKVTSARLLSDKNTELVAKETRLNRTILNDIPRKYWREFQLDGDGRTESKIVRLADQCEDDKNEVEIRYQEKIDKLEKSDELPPGVLKLVKVYVAIKRRLSVGDKMAGRHGNKGVVSRILPQEDMPYLSDGTPVDIVLNPLGVPSRMNVGQILETHLGWAARLLGTQIDSYLKTEWSPEVLREKLNKIFPKKEAVEYIKQLNDDDIGSFCHKLCSGVHMETPVFDGAKESEIKAMLKMAGCRSDGQSILHDGRTGEQFAQHVTVGIMYMLKLHHLVDEKIHARSIGPYSLVTQQPLGGKAQFGGQRLGEMEAWAMKGHGAAHALQEFLTVKSDDVSGRTRMYESIVKGVYALEAGIPASFDVLVKELQSLCLNIEMSNKSPSTNQNYRETHIPAGLAAIAREVADKPVASSQNDSTK